MPLPLIHSPRQPSRLPSRANLLAWPAWCRVLALVPLLVVMWVATFWALGEPASW